MVREIKKLIEKSTMKKRSKLNKLAPKHAWSKILTKSCSIKEELYKKWSNNKTDIKLGEFMTIIPSKIIIPFNYSIKKLNQLRYLLKLVESKYMQETILNNHNRFSMSSGT